MPVFGSLWWVKESFWKQALPLYDEVSNRNEHPAVSLLSQKAGKDFDAVPMLYGRSARVEDGVQIKGLTHRDPDKISWFGRYRFPVRIPIALWPSDAHPEILHRDPKNRKTHGKSSGATIRVNLDKPMINEFEKQKLTAWCQKRRILF